MHGEESPTVQTKCLGQERLKTKQTQSSAIEEQTVSRLSDWQQLEREGR